ncbi:hypothetical protein TrCOL_g1929, partial [Triparma columacea]
MSSSSPGDLPPPPPGLTQVSVGGLQNSGRTTSFANLAAAVGSGLAESMDDSFVQSSYVRKFHTRPSDVLSNDNAHRQSKHNKNRTLGSSLDDYSVQSHSHFGSGTESSPSFVFATSMAPALSNDNTQPMLGAIIDDTTSVPVQTLFSHSSTTRSRKQEYPHQSGFGSVGGSMGSLERQGRPLFGESDSRSSSPTDRTISTSTTNSTNQSTSLAPGAGYTQPSREGFPAAINAVLAHPSSPPCWQQLVPFLKLPRGSSPPCTGLVVMGVFDIQSSTLRTACEVFGALHNFRTDFLRSRGVAFVSYFDVRAAKEASVHLVSELSKLSYSSGGGLQNAINIHVFYCTPLHYSGVKDESAILIKYLPDTIEEEDIYRTLSSYGDVKKINEQVADDINNTASFLVKFYDLQDSKQAHLELSSSNPWGPGVSVSFANHTSAERKSGKQLLELIGLWRHGPSVKLDATKTETTNETASLHSSNSAKSSSHSGTGSKTPSGTGTSGSSSTPVASSSHSGYSGHHHVVYPQSDYYSGPPQGFPAQ